MKRVALILAIVCGVALSVPTAHATHQPLAHGLFGELKSLHVPSASAARSLLAAPREMKLPRETRLQPQKRADAVDPNSTQLQASAFSPAELDSQYVGTEDNATADGNPFINWHAQKYEALGRISGFYMRAHINYGSDVAYERYQSSIFSSASQALGAFNDAKTFLSGQQVTLNDCTSTVNLPCGMVGYISTTNDQVEGFFVQVGLCLSETEAVAPQADYTANQNQLNTILANVTAAAIQLLSSVCSGNPPPPNASPTPTSTKTPPTRIDFQLISVLVEKNGAAADWNQTRAPLKQVKKGAKVQLAIYFVVNSAPPSEPLIVHWTVTQNGKTLVNQDFTGRLCPNPTCSTSDPDLTYRDVVGPLTLKAAGKVQVTGRLAMGGQAEQGSTSFTVLKPHQKTTTPPPPAHFSYSFNGLSVTEHGKAGRSFAAGSSIVIVATYAAHKVPAGHPVTGDMRLTYQQPQNGQFRPFSTGHESFLVSKDGTHRQGHPTSFGAPGTVRIVVGLTIGGIYHQKSIDITLR